MIILAENPKEKGQALERIVKEIMLDMGYQNIKTNVVGHGDELDITAEWDDGSNSYCVIGECKATVQPANMDQWQKLLGKVYSGEATKNEVHAGLFITFDATEHVKANYRALLDAKALVFLLTERELFPHLQKIYRICSHVQINKSLRNILSLVPSNYELVYYEQNFYWAVLFSNEKFGVVDKDGSPSPNISKKVIKILKSEIKSKMKGISYEYFDLSRLVREKSNIIVMKKILAEVIKSDSKKKISEFDLGDSIMCVHLKPIIHEMKDLGLLNVEGNNVILPKENEALKRVLTFLLNGVIPDSTLFAHEKFKELTRFILDIFCKRYQLDIAIIEKIVTLSPSAFYQILIFDMIKDEKKLLNADGGLNTEALLTLLKRRLIMDMDNEYVNAIFLKSFNLKSFKIKKEVKIVDENGNEITYDDITEHS